ncbi:MAG: hypothetical protein COA69_08365 [Robiginitomaculum sp.]|nr:MAG: hypothetical protein COA69_08365 [Robiginitomaculum sp.]
MSDTPLEKPKTNTKANVWILTLFASVALNGLLAGVLISNQAGPKSADLQIAPFMPAPHQAVKKRPLRNGPLAGEAYDAPRMLISHLSPPRRKEIMGRAMKHIKTRSERSPHTLLIELRKSHKQTLALLRADTLDQDALKTILAQNRELKQRLALQGDALVLEMLKQLTPEERKATVRALRKTKYRRFKKHKAKNKRD